MEKLVFPKDFLWGAATSAHQVEGGNTNSDWWQWEQAGGGKEPSGQACRHYSLFEKDFDLAKQLNHNCHRLSVEWARVQPAPNEFSRSEIEHYRDVISALRERSIEPVVTLHHFTNPFWFLRMGGWSRAGLIKYFLDYVRAMTEALGDMVSLWVTINEPLVYAYYSYGRGWWPPQESSLLKTRIVSHNLMKAHLLAYRIINQVCKKNNFRRPRIGIAHNMVDFVACRPNLVNRAAASLRNWLYNREILDKLSAKGSLDYIGLNYYTRNLIDSRGCSVSEMMINVCRDGHDTLGKNCMGWEIYPQGILDILRQLKGYRLPVLILENGICTEDDSLRELFIREHLKKVHTAISEGIKVEGYLYWSLLDNFEWDKGFAPRFGLVEVDFATFERRIRPSARALAEICRTGQLE